MRQSLDTHGGIVKGGGRRDAPLHVQSMPKWELFRKFPFWRFKLSTLCRQLGATFGRLTGGGQKEATTGRPYGWVAEGWHLIRHLLRWDLIRRFAPPVHLAVPENPVGLALSPPCRNAIPGPASLRPANGAAAEIAGSLPLPPAAGASNSSGFSTAAEIPASLPLPPAARSRNSPCAGKAGRRATARAKRSEGRPYGTRPVL